MNDLHNRFRSLDDVPAPDLWREVENRAQALGQRGVRTVSWTLIALVLLLAVAIGSAALIGSGIVKLPAVIEASATPDEASPDASATAEPDVPLGGGMILVRAAALDTGLGGFDVFMLDAGSGQETLLGTLPNLASPHGGYSFQWGLDRKHVLITGNGPGPDALENLTVAGRELTFICCKLPDEVVPTTKGDGTSSSRPAGAGWVLSPQGDRIAGLHDGPIDVPGCLLCDAPDAVVILDIDSGDVRTLPLPVGTRGAGPISWSPDGSAVAVSGCRPCNDAGLIASTSGGIGDSGGDWSKLTPSAIEHAHVLIVPIDGSPVRELFDATETTVGPAAWSPNGATIAFARNECPPGEHAPYCLDGTITVVSLALADGEQTVVAERDAGALAWSPDGSRIAFGGAGIFIVDADGSHVAKLSDVGLEPRWSPDGEWLLFFIQDESGPTYSPWIVSAEGGQPRSLGSYAGGAAW
jgi:hypothetical protein